MRRGFSSAAMILRPSARRSARRKIRCAPWNGSMSRTGEEIHIMASARSFLHSQVRSWWARSNMWVPANGASRIWGAALAACDRRRCGMVAPPEGLLSGGRRLWPSGMTGGARVKGQSNPKSDTGQFSQ